VTERPESPITGAAKRLGLVTLLAGILVALLGFLTPPASAASVLHPHTRVAAIAEPNGQLVGPHADVLAVQGRERAPNYDSPATGSCLAAEGGANDLAAGWRGTNMTDDESFEYHYQVHGDGVTPEQYAQDARAWASHPTGTGTPVELADGTWGMRYRTPGGGPGGILDSSGNIITFWYR
jgi:hypothetical protein